MNRPRFRSWFHEFRAWVLAGGVTLVAMSLSDKSETLAVAFVYMAVFRLMAFYWSLK